MRKIFLTVLLLFMSLGTINAAAASNDEWFIYYIDDNEAHITGVCDYVYDYSGVLEFPSELEGYPVTSIGGCFYEDAQMCDLAFNFTEIIIPEGVKSIGKETFMCCTSIKKVTLPESLIEIGKYAFIGCGFTEVSIPQSVTYIGEQAFSECENLSDVKLSSGITKIEFATFSDCTSLKSIEIPSSVTSIGQQAFEGSGVTSISIPSSVTEMGSWAFARCQSLKSITSENFKTSIIGEYMFEGCTSLVSVELNDSVPEIGDYAFNECTALKEVVLGKCVEYVGHYAFANCTSLDSLAMSANDERYIGNHAFDSCIALKTLVIPAKTRLSLQVFVDCTGLENVIFEENAGYIGGYTFRRCTSLKSVTISKGVTWDGYGAFGDCTALESVNINCNSVGDRAFENCTKLSNVVLGSNVESIKYKAFYNTGIVELEIPDNITSISTYAFSACKSLKAVKIPNTVISMGNSVFSSCSALENVTIEDGFTRLEPHMFKSCTALKTITLPKSIPYIGEDAFASCKNLESISIGCGVSEIGIDAFYGCSKLSDVYYNGTKNKWSKITIGTRNTPLTDANIHYITPEISSVTATDLSADNLKLINVKAEFEDVPNYALIWAVSYDSSGKLLGIKEMPLSNPNINIPSTDVEKVTVFVWEDLGSIAPMCESKSETV